MSDIRIELDEDAIASMWSTQGQVGRSFDRMGRRIADRTRTNIASYGRVKTGRMLRSVTHTTTFDGNDIDVTVSVDVPYAIYQHEGTRRGITPAPFLTDALATEGTVANLTEGP